MSGAVLSDTMTCLASLIARTEGFETQSDIS